MSVPAVSHACPSREELGSFCRGALSTCRLEELAEHLENCRDCQAALEGVAHQADALLNELRAIPAVGRPEDGLVSGDMAAIESSCGAFFSDTWDERRSAAADEGLPQRLGEYEILAAIGQGGMGAVYRARHSRLDKVVAIKLLPPYRVGDAAAAARFQREMRAIGKLSHPNIVAATDAGEIDGTAYLAMEFVDGADAARLVERRGRLPIAEACELVRQAAVGLHYAHSHGLVHRDIKPSNLLLTPAPDQPTGGLVKVADLGLALLSEAESENPGDGKGDWNVFPERPEGCFAQNVPVPFSSATSMNLMIGSLDYMAPEQADDAHRVDHRADLYALGCTLYELLSGKPPFAAPKYQTRLQKMKAHGDAVVPALGDVCPGLPAGLEPLVRRLLAKDPANRFATAAELATALVPFAAGANLPRLLDETSPEIFPPALEKAELPPRRRRLTNLMLGCLGLVALGSVVYVQTDRGTLEIKSDDDEVKVRVEQDGKLITLVDLKSNKEIRLRSGTYEVALGDNDQDLALDADEFTLHRGGKEVLHIRRQAPTLLRAPFDADEAKRHQERWARFRGVSQTVKNDLGMSLTLIPPGEFEMRAGYHVKITKPYYLGTYEVTVGQFREFTAASGYTTDLEREGRGVLDIVSFKETLGMNWRTKELALSESHPVAGITWFDAEKFCTWLCEKEEKKYRLPTEAEWEWAARGGSMSTYGWGDDETSGGDLAWHQGNSDHRSHPVGEKRANAWGLHDTNGNLVEWCQDWAVDPYPKGEISDPLGPTLTSGTRTLRGGSFLDAAMPMISRGAFGPTQSMIHCGFRICREL